MACRSKDPFGRITTAAEAAECLRWTRLPADQVIDLLVAEHVTNRTEAKRRENLQLVLDLHDDGRKAAMLPGIAASKHFAMCKSRGLSGKRVSRPYQVELHARADLVRTVQSSSAHGAHLMRASTSRQKPQMRHGHVQTVLLCTFQTPEEAADWRDGIIFALYGMCGAELVLRAFQYKLSFGVDSKMSNHL